MSRSQTRMKSVTSLMEYLNQCPISNFIVLQNFNQKVLRNKERTDSISSVHFVRNGGIPGNH